MKQSEPKPGRPLRKLNLLDAVCIIVGTVIGSGIFGTAGTVAGLLPDGRWLLWVWLAGGLISLVGSLCFAELSTAHNQPGGDYYYLSRAFGYPTGLAFAWAAFWIIRPGNIGAMAMVFAEYAVPLLRLNDSIQAKLLLALGCVAVFSVTNMLGVRSGKATQNVLTIIKVLGILAIFGAVGWRFFSVEAPAVLESDPRQSSASLFSLFLPMVLVMFAYGGWNDIAFVAAEVRRPRVNLPWALFLGTLTVTLCYLGFNLALLLVLGYDGLVSAGLQAPAQMMLVCAGQSGTDFLNALVCISCLGAINGMIFTSPRIYFAVGQQYPQFSWLASWGGQRDGPWAGILCQALVSVLLILICGTRDDGFTQILAVTAPFFWVFLGLTFVSLLVLRRVDDSNPLAFRVPLFPLPPIFMTLVSLAIAYSSIRYTVSQRYFWAALIVTSIMVVGIGVAVLIKPKSKKTIAS